MAMSWRWFTVVPAAVAAVALLAACGSPKMVEQEDVTRVTDVANLPVIEATPEAGGDTGGGGASAASTGEVTITSHDIYFEPTEVTIPAAADIKVILPNLGAAPHNFAIDALNISQDQAPGETHEVTINAPAGEYEYYCNVPGHKDAGMVGKLVADPNLKVGAAPAADAAAPADAAPAADAADAAAPVAAESVTVTSHDIYFDPTEFTIPADTDVTVVLPNEGAAPHNFAIDALNISQDQMPGETHEVTINAPAGEYEYYCNVPGHKDAGMVGKMTAS
ncbi:MAG: cupredoxin domain-containing protein [Chloroflexota bacterium]